MLREDGMNTPRENNEGRKGNACVMSEVRWGKDGTGGKNKGEIKRKTNT